MSNNTSKETVTVMVFGTFDGLHAGHLHFFKQARKLVGLKKEPFLVISIARDKNVKKIKGKIPDLNEKQRKLLVEQNKLVDRVVFAGVHEHLPHILKEKPNIIALGYDQEAYVKNLRKDLAEKGLLVKIVRLKSYKPHKYKNHLIKKRVEII